MWALGGLRSKYLRAPNFVRKVVLVTVIPFRCWKTPRKSNIYVFYRVGYYNNVPRAHWLVKTLAPTLSVLWFSDKYQRKHQVSALLILYEGNPRMSGGFASQRASNNGHVFVLSHCNGVWHITSSSIVGIWQSHVCATFSQSGIIAPTW